MQQYRLARAAHFALPTSLYHHLIACLFVDFDPHLCIVLLIKSLPNINFVLQLVQNNS